MSEADVEQVMADGHDEDTPWPQETDDDDDDDDDDDESEHKQPAVPRANTASASVCPLPPAIASAAQTRLTPSKAQVSWTPDTTERAGAFAGSPAEARQRWSAGTSRSAHDVMMTPRAQHLPLCRPRITLVATS